MLILEGGRRIENLRRFEDGEWARQLNLDYSLVMRDIQRDEWRLAQESERKSLKLLERFLFPNQLAQWKAQKRFIVNGKKRFWSFKKPFFYKPPWRYVITARMVNNVYQVRPDGHVHAVLCAHGVLDDDRFHYPPLGDSLLSQKLMLETDEKRFLKIANATDYGSFGPLLKPL